jgi:hypothetical protein
MTVFSKHLFSQGTTDTTWVSEASDIGIGPADRYPFQFYIAGVNDPSNPFTFNGRDMTPDGDLAGVRYRTEDRKLNALIIND